ncbi:MAG TPA: c-type cytochrome [Kofleriaceae bacterium]|nr:c-type cytochrome [Kofleriaceae bacterium]
MRVPLVLVASLAARAAAADPRELPGWPLYDRLCLACHGARGDGRGPAALLLSSRPRALADGNFAWRSTALGRPPTDEDLRITLRYGAPGTAMPGFGDVLGPAELDELDDVIKAFAPAAFARPGAPVAIGPPRPPDPARGAYLWAQLACDHCHGVRGHGDGASAKGLAVPPYDLVAEPLHRPRASDDVAARRRAAVESIATGMAGTAMPGYAGEIADADLWALADRAIELELGERPAPARRALAPAAVLADLAAPAETAAWPGASDDPDAIVFGAAVPAQGDPPASLAPAEASLDARQCGRCHAPQLRDWQGSLHAGAISPGVRAQIDHGMARGEVARCLRCHAPLAEQRGDRELRAQGASCAGCHVRGWIRRGPARPSPTLLSAPGYPREPLAIYERSDFCMPCHQLMPRDAVAGAPLLDTYREWLAGPYARRGIQCQHCHMSNREHRWLGVHDRDTFGQAIALAATAHRRGGVVSVLAELRNIGAGHDLPTTATPAVWLRIELVDAHGVAIAGARGELRIGRDVFHDASGWHERGDTRIPPGEVARLARGWTGGRTAEAAFARITVEVQPDAYYERFYADRLAAPPPADARAEYEQALARARASHYVAARRDVAIP